MADDVVAVVDYMQTDQDVVDLVGKVGYRMLAGSFAVVATVAVAIAVVVTLAEYTYLVVGIVAGTVVGTAVDAVAGSCGLQRAEQSLSHQVD